MAECWMSSFDNRSPCVAGLGQRLDLVAAVSNAGGLGTLGPNSGADSITADVELTGERMRGQIKKVRRLTGAPFAVNIVAGFGEALKYSQKMVEVVIE